MLKLTARNRWQVHTVRRRVSEWSLVPCPNAWFTPCRSLENDVRPGSVVCWRQLALAVTAVESGTPTCVVISYSLLSRLFRGSWASHRSLY